MSKKVLEKKKSLYVKKINFFVNFEVSVPLKGTVILKATPKNTLLLLCVCVCKPIADQFQPFQFFAV